MSIQQNNTEKRLARLEAVSNQIKSEMDDVLENAYRIACEEQDEERAAELAAPGSTYRHFVQRLVTLAQGVGGSRF